MNRQMSKFWRKGQDRFRQTEIRTGFGWLRSAGRPSAEEPFTLRTLSGQLAHTTHGLGFLARPLLRWLFVKVTHLHFAEDTFTLHFLLERTQRLINIVVPNKYLHVLFRSFVFAAG